MFNKLNFHVILLTLILVLGFGLRTYRLGEIPSGFFADEASIGYNAYTILTKGTDEYGTSYPLFFRAFGEYKSPIQIYATIPFVALFGLNEFSTRLPSAIFGTLTILAIYLLTKELFTWRVKNSARKQSNNEAIALMTTFFLAISPWHIHFSRVALEGLMPFVFFTTFGSYLFLKSRTYHLLLLASAAMFILAMYSYFVARLFIPLFGLLLIPIYAHSLIKHKKEMFISFLLVIILLLPLINHTLSPVGFSRWQQVSVFTDSTVNTNITEHIMKNYTSHFSLDFLFFKGDVGMLGQFITRHSVRGIGELYLLQFPFLLFGFFYLFRKGAQHEFLLLITWFFLYPVGSMFTASASAQATRSIIGVIPFQIVSAVGLYWTMNFLRCFERSKKNQFIHLFSTGIIIVIITASFLNTFDLYFKKYPFYSSNFWGWQYGAKDIVQYFSVHEASYDDLVMIPEFNAPEIFFKFYAPNACAKCKVGLPHDMHNSAKRQLFAVTPTYLSQHSFIRLHPLSTIFYPNKTIAFQIGEVVE